MAPRCIWLAPLVLLALCLPAAGARPASTDAAPGEPLAFETHVRPILKAYCFQCHGDDGERESGLDLRLVRSMRAGGDSGPTIAAGKHADSLLYQRIAAGDMPPGEKKVSADELAVIGRWLDAGAPTARPEPESADAVLITEEERAHWAFQPVRRPEVPEVPATAGATSPIDAFLYQRLATEGLSFSPPADRATLARRVYFDLWGLPPSPEEVDAFVNDPAPDAWERLIDRLLASPHYGERWGRHWLDVAGYADSDGGSERDVERPYAYKYRDYVIRAFNDDKPLDEFICEQLAGDEMLTPPYRDLSPDEADKLVATGFLRMAPDATSDPAADNELARHEVLAETIKIVSSSLLGLSVGCAQCHTHRYDPIPQVDYYRMRAIFEPGYDPANWRRPQQRLISLMTAEQNAAVARVEKELKELAAERTAEIAAKADESFEIELAKLPEAIRDDFRLARNTPDSKKTKAQKALIREHLSSNITTANVSLYDRRWFNDLTARVQKRTEEINARRPPDNFAHCLTETPGKTPVTRLLFRGDVNEPREEVAPGELSVLSPGTTLDFPRDDPALSTTGRRLAYARHLTDGRHPLVGRVLANRIWMHHFGRGLVATPSEFGLVGEPPSHPELLDWLADELVASGWRLKRFHKLLLMSTAYQQSSRRTPELDALDSDNRLLGRMSVRRLAAEEVRDALLAVNGRLNRELFGAPVPVMPDEVGQVVVGVDTRDTAGRPTGKFVDLGETAYRRSVYVQTRRSMPLGMLEAFDMPVLEPNCEARSSSTVAPQALLLMNNLFVIEQSETFARRILAAVPSDLAEQVGLAWRHALATDPSPEQLAGAVAFVTRQQQVIAEAAAGNAASKDPAALNPQGLALANLCQALFSSNAFLYID